MAGDPATVPNDDARVAVLAPLGRNAAVICRILAGGGVDCTATDTMAGLIERMGRGVDAAVITEESLTAATAAELAAALAAQPPWSDLPVLLLLAATTDPNRAASTGPVGRVSAAGNVTVFVRPVPAVALATAVRSALRARHRQCQARDATAAEHAARLDAERANAVKDEFLAAVSHDLRTPLSAILLWGRLLGTGRFDAAQQREGLDLIVRSAEAQSRLVEDLLDASRMAAGQLRLDVADVDLGPVAAAAAAVVRPAADAKGVRLDLAVAPAPAPVRADVARVQQVLWNVLNNAVKFTPAGGRVSLTLTDDGTDVVIRVADTGRGIAPDFLPHVFERFRQADATPAGRHGGLGLGLSIAGRLVDLHGGSIAVESPGVGCGATFTVRLPLAVPVVAGLPPHVVAVA